MRFAVTVIQPPGYQHSEAFREVAETVHFALLRLGHDSVLTREPRLPRRRHIIFGCNLLPGYPVDIPEDSILYNLEQVYRGSPWVGDDLLSLFRKYTVWDYSARNILELQRMGVDGTYHVPIGHVPELERIKPAVQEDIDVLLVGSLNERRLELIRQLSSTGLNAVARFGVYGEERDELIARAKIVLNLHFHQARVFEIVRVSYLLANGRFVVSERGSNPDEEAPFAPGMIFGEYAEIADLCRYYVNHDDERRARADVGQSIMRSRCATDILRSALAALPGDDRPPVSVMHPARSAEDVSKSLT
ncbi:glycosyltransferase [Streptomyces sp. Ru72]|uniref:glycosyltransferase family protein n=1 Tax=Streptomyces sp. Ru72 TaxID=2080747 RepID=UPI0015E2A24B|nr:glycosyltransferase [Streptomyces sp. Ru72]